MNYLTKIGKQVQERKVLQFFLGGGKTGKVSIGLSCLVSDSELRPVVLHVSAQVL